MPLQAASTRDVTEAAASELVRPLHTTTFKRGLPTQGHSIPWVNPNMDSRTKYFLYPAVQANLELVSKELNHFVGIALFFRDWASGTLTGGA